MGFIEFYLVTISYISNHNKKGEEVMAVTDDGLCCHSYSVIVQVNEEHEYIGEVIQKFLAEREGLETGFKVITNFTRLEAVNSVTVLPPK